MSSTRRKAARARPLWLAAAAALVLLPLAAAAAAQEARQPSAERPAVTAPKLVLPDLGAPATANRVAAASRGQPGGTQSVAPAERLRLTLLVPEQTGLTASAAPTLYWHASADAGRPVVLTVNDDDSGAVEPLVEAELADGGRAGVNGVDLGRFGIELAPGREYGWSVTVVNDPAAPSSDIVATAVIRRVALEPTLAAKLADADPSGRLQLLAAEGLWYDLLAEVGGLIEARPDEPAYREIRAALLDQVELGEVAAAERARAGG